MAAETRTLRTRSTAAVGSGRRLLARAIGVVAAVVVLILLVGIALVLLEANQANDLVAWLRDASSWLAGPFEEMFTFDRRRTQLAVNWGVAALVWFVVGQVLVRLVKP